MCQSDRATSSKIWVDSWSGIERINIPVRAKGALGTIEFDWLSSVYITKVSSRNAVVLTLGYNTAVFSVLYKFKRLRSLINMDGLEWKRKKWRLHQKLWLFLNERAASFLADELIADHPEIARHLLRFSQKNKVTMIPYGSDRVSREDFHADYPGLEKNSYALLIARPEPENSILEIVKAFSRKKRQIRLAILGSYSADNEYQSRVMNAASDDVLFLGALYDQRVVQTLRANCLIYVHGHRVGGTNPSLVEALGAGSPVLAHDNIFNRWVAGRRTIYFSDEDSCSDSFDYVCSEEFNSEEHSMSSRERWEAGLSWDVVLSSYAMTISRHSR